MIPSGGTGDPRRLRHAGKSGNPIAYGSIEGQTLHRVVTLHARRGRRQEHAIGVEAEIDVVVRGRGCGQRDRR